jgi:hypothetical protein
MIPSKTRWSCSFALKPAKLSLGSSFLRPNARLLVGAAPRGSRRPPKFGGGSATPAQQEKAPLWTSRGEARQANQGRSSAKSLSMSHGCPGSIDRLVTHPGQNISSHGVSAIGAARIVGDHSSLRPVADRRCQRSTRSRFRRAASKSSCEISRNLFAEALFKPDD